MKRFVSVLLLVSSSAFALNGPVVENVTQRVRPTLGDSLNGLPSRLITQTTFEVSVVSCAAVPEGALRVETGVSSGGLDQPGEPTVTIVNRMDMDCMGPTQKRSYRVSTTTLRPGQRYILNNPTVLKLTVSQ